MKFKTTEKKTVLMLASVQALFQTISVMVMTLSGVVGLKLATDKSLATLPIAMMMVGAALMMIPAAMIMKRIGRRNGFLIGVTIGCIAGIVAALAVWRNQFYLFVFANMLIGVYQAFSQYYRFAAADVASDAFRSRAISWVIGGGVFAAIAGPNIARVTQNIGTTPYIMSYLAITIVISLAYLFLWHVQLPKPSDVDDHNIETARPLIQIMKQPVFLTALAGSALGYAVMSMVMTATPLAMQICGQASGAAATVIQWHVLGMFVPSFFTGRFIAKWGVLRVMSAGIVLLCTHVLVSLDGSEFVHFISGLTLLGVGWNFLFIGGTTLLTEAYRPNERAKTQAAHDFCMFSAISIASLSAGGLLNVWGWRTLNLTVLPFLALVLIAVMSLGYRRRQKGPCLSVS